MYCDEVENRFTLKTYLENALSRLKFYIEFYIEKGINAVLKALNSTSFKVKRKNGVFEGVGGARRSFSDYLP